MREQVAEDPFFRNLLKGKDRLVGGSGCDWPLKHMRWGQVDRNTEEVGEVIFEPDHVEQG